MFCQWMKSWNKLAISNTMSRLGTVTRSWKLYGLKSNDVWMEFFPTSIPRYVNTLRVKIHTKKLTYSPKGGNDEMAKLRSSIRWWVMNDDFWKVSTGVYWVSCLCWWVFWALEYFIDISQFVVNSKSRSKIKSFEQVKLIMFFQYFTQSAYQGSIMFIRYYVFHGTEYEVWIIGLRRRIKNKCPFVW